MIEFGSAPHFTLSYKESSEIKYSAMNTLYSTQYQTWLGDAVEIYQKTNDALKNVVNSTVIDHAILAEGIKKVTYDNGQAIAGKAIIEDTKAWKDGRQVFSGQASLSADALGGLGTDHAREPRDGVGIPKPTKTCDALGHCTVRMVAR